MHSSNEFRVGDDLNLGAPWQVFEANRLEAGPLQGRASRAASVARVNFRLAAFARLMYIRLGVGALPGRGASKRSITRSRIRTSSSRSGWPEGSSELRRPKGEVGRGENAILHMTPFALTHRDHLAMRVKTKKFQKLPAERVRAVAR